jgi:DNA-binding transcriptional regulator YhcF (GntR family)
MGYNFANDKPIFFQLADVIKGDIVSGKYKITEKLPSVRDFAFEFGVNPNTVQKALQIKNEIAAIDAEAKKKVVAARGFADSLKIVADGEAYYNRTVSASLSNTLVQMKALEKWDGKTPIVSGGGSTFIDASKFVK